MTTLDIDQKLSELTAFRDQLQKVLTRIDQNIETLEEAKAVAAMPTERWISEALLGHSKNRKENGVAAQSNSTPSSRSEQKIPTVDYRVDMIAQCENIYPACELLAGANDGNLVVNPASQTIRDAGISDAKDNGSLSATINNYLKERPGEWKKMEKGWWKRIPTTIDSAEVILPEMEKLSEQSEVGNITALALPWAGSTEDNLGEH